jgi:hypothetical protein
MLEQWEQESTSLLLGEEKDQLLLQAQSDSDVLDLDAPVPERARQSGNKNQYDSFFD